MMPLLLLLLQLLSIVLCLPAISAGPFDVPLAKPGCEDNCGNNVTIPYPFGIGAGCYHNKSYEIICNNGSHPARPYLHQFNVEVLEINFYQSSYDRQELSVNMKPQNICTSTGSGEAALLLDLRGTPYRYSARNVFVAKGCSGGIVVSRNSRNDGFLTACASVCPHNGTRTHPRCDHGIGCCTTTLGKDTDVYKIAPNREALAASDSDHACNSLVALTDPKYLSKDIEVNSPVATLLSWRFPDPPQTSSDRVSCPGEYGCTCGIYAGNPYLPNGCEASICVEYDDGSFQPCKKRPLQMLAAILGISIGLGFVLLLLGGYWLYRLVKSRRETKRKAKYFKINGGLLLQQQMSSTEGFVEKTKIFRAIELQKATDNFNKSRILGQGGQGTVFKGMLMDGKIIAIKKSKKVDEGQLEQFINEVVILSQINHRNVVKLLGCCLETEVPLLVYEFILNGTLYQHIHDPNEEFQITWKMRLQIAVETAGALTYLHSSSSAPIYHRDIKSSNILLDDKYKAKVSDFGTSRVIAIDQTHVTTCVQGTYGYLDPEYFQSHQFTEKSDVYSFGVVLVELITGKKPILNTKDGGWISLAAEFLSHMENSLLFDILDTRVFEEGKEEEFIAVANLARECLNVNGKQRPTMKEVATRLEAVLSPHVANSTETNKTSQRTHVVTEMSDTLGYPSSVSTFFSDDGPHTSCSIDVQPLIANTI